MDVAFEVSHGLLARRVIAERDVDVGVDQTGNCGRSSSVDDNVAALNIPGRRRADELDLLVESDDRVALDEGRAPIPETIVPMLVMAARI
jgi:hypothetical protein